ncbi:hypothetical protein AB0I30_24380 [Nocardia tengchongensis]|uniref:hypothetical protein n=1 Tax=Nocardia tengchongensis TaxID=2055889 RepID=UPI00340492B5
MGALGETPNTVLGERIERSQQFRTVVEMAMTFTQVGQQDWALTIDAVPRTDTDRWQCLAEIACRMAGLTIIETRTPPPFVLSEDEKREIFEEAGRVLAARQRKLDEIPFSTPFRAFADDFED